MKTLIIKIASIALIGAALFYFNTTVEARVEEDKKLREEYQAAKQEMAESEGSSYEDGNYSGEGEGFGGLIEVSVSVVEGKISDIKIVSADGEDGPYLEMAKDIIPSIIDAQTKDVDTVSGATFSSTGIKDAAQAALSEAEK